MMERLTGIGFTNPEGLLLLLLIPLYVFWYLRFFRRQRLVIRLNYAPANPSGTSWIWRSLHWLPKILQLSALALLILALARPQTERRLVDPVAMGLDVMLLIDVSASMDNRDVSPSRIEAAKEMAIRFIEGRKYDQIGLTVFSDEALNYSPLTLDYEFLKNLIRSTQTRFFSGPGTAIGDAVAAALNRMREHESPGRVIILLTDGANNTGQIAPQTAARLAQSYHARIYPVGMGTATGIDPISGEAVSAELDEPGLRQLARLSGGTYFRATERGALDAIFAEISRLETRELQPNDFLVVEDHYAGLIKVAILCLALAFLMMLTPLYNPLEQ